MPDVTFYLKGEGLRPITRFGAALDPDGACLEGEAWISGLWPDDRFAVVDGKAVPHVAERSHQTMTWLVKQHAQTLIVQRYPLWKQANIDRDGGKPQSEMVAFIDAIRAASNRIEAMDPIPADYTNSIYWD